MRKCLFLLFFNTLAVLLWGERAQAQVTYTRQDSIKVVELLAAGAKYKYAVKKDLMTFYGNKLKGVPYVAATLEVNKTERLIVNLRELDCTTFVETVLALAMTTSQGSRKWDDYCANLMKIRYRNGVISGYPSRNHYFLWWVESNRRLGIVETPMDKDFSRGNLSKQRIYRQQKININWMSTHTSAYPMLKNNAQFIREIARHEKQSQGKSMMYIPQVNLGLSKQKMKWVENGDILAICTRKKGLDTTHIGIAVWGDDGKLHLLNASQIHKKVVLESMTLKEYMSHHPSQLGVWVVKPHL
ncbi:MAG: DUF1460 domain-containing protein [Prevotella sp.]|nr:DUF1460 domain-containing protein [Prevotella sp.]